MPLSARAGDQIEFSAPSSSLAVPHVESADKESLKSSLQTSESAADMVPVVDGDYSSEVVIVSAPKKKNARTGDFDFTDNRNTDTDIDADADADADRDYDRLDSKLQPVDDTTNNLWDRHESWDADTGGAFSERRNNEVVSRENRLDRLDEAILAGRTYSQRDERDGRRSPDSDADPAWSRSLFHHDLTGLERMQEGKFISFSDEIQADNEPPSQAYSVSRSFNAENNLQRDDTLFPGLTDYNSQRDRMRDPSQDGLLAPRTFKPAETRSVNQNSDPYARQEPPPSPPGQVQSRPAILPFPKRPGSVFQ
jgi:hypothetical protein